MAKNFIIASTNNFQLIVNQHTFITIGKYPQPYYNPSIHYSNKQVGTYKHSILHFQHNVPSIMTRNSYLYVVECIDEENFKLEPKAPKTSKFSDP